MNKYNSFSEIVQNDTNESSIKEAYNMSLLDYSKDDIIKILSEKNDEIKIMPIINLKSIDNKKEAELLLNHLTGKDGRIREAVSYALSEINPNAEFLSDDKSLEILTNGILDINPNVVRNLICFFKQNNSLKENITPFIIKKTEDILIELSKFLKESSPYKENCEKSQKNHAKNKLTFNLYWLLSTISILNINNIRNLENILTKTADFLDYTIREKTALILSKMENPPNELLQKLKQDENIYVKNQLL